MYKRKIRPALITLVREKITPWLPRFDPHYPLRSNVLEVRNLKCLLAALNWTNTPILDGEFLHDFDNLEDLNDRRIRDAEVIGAACCNGNPKILLEIGTSYGMRTTLMAQNAPDGVVYTVNIPPEEIDQGGNLITFAPRVEDIGWYYRERGYKNIRQIFANTAKWKPDFGPIDVTFIDGCHDADFVYNDTRIVLEKCRPGSVILWHDFAPDLAPVYSWINQVCTGISRLYTHGIIRGRILHLQDSWVGLYQVPNEASLETFDRGSV